MHVEGAQIYQVDRQPNSFQNLYDMLEAKAGRSARKIDSLHKNTSKTIIFVCTNLGYLTLEGPRRQTVDPWSTSGLPLKTWGYDGSN